MLIARPRLIGIRLASSSQVRQAILRMKKHLPLVNILAQGGEVPSNGTSLPLMASQYGCAVSQLKRVALKSLGCIWPRRAPHMKHNYPLGPGGAPMGRAPGYFRTVVKEAGDPLARASVEGRECICDELRVLFTPYVALAKGARQPRISPGGVRHALGILRTLSCFAKDAARAETSALRLFRATYAFTDDEASSRQFMGPPSGRRGHRRCPL